MCDRAFETEKSCCDIGDMDGVEVAGNARVLTTHRRRNYECTRCHILARWYIQSGKSGLSRPRYSGSVVATREQCRGLRPHELAADAHLSLQIELLATRCLAMPFEPGVNRTRVINMQWSVLHDPVAQVNHTKQADRK